MYHPNNFQNHQQQQYLNPNVICIKTDLVNLIYMYFFNDLKISNK
jgi:hypothetical protein